MAFTFEQLLAADPSNPSNIAQNASITIFAPGDPTMAPIPITDPDGSPLPNPFPVNANGFGPAFAHATLDRVAWSGGGFTGYLTSYEGMKAEAVAARAAAEGAASGAAAAAQADLEARIASGVFKGEKGADGANVLPTEDAIAAAINGNGPAKAALSATIAENPTVVGKVDKTGIPINVKDLGAVGDGSANDTAIIQSALNTARAVFIPEGTWRLVAATGFALTNTGQRKRTIYGAGPGVTILKMDAGGEGGVIDVTGGTLADLSIDGGFTPAVGEANLLSCVQANNDSTVRNCHIYNARGSCLVGVGTRISFLNNRLEKFGDHAIYFAGDIDTASPFNILKSASRVKVIGNQIDDDPTYHNNATSGTVRGTIKIRDNVSDVLISGNTVYGDICVLIDGDTRRSDALPRDVRIISNTLTCSYAAVNVNTKIDATAGDTGYRVEDIVVQGNTMRGTDAANTGVLLSRARARIINNDIRTVDGVNNAESGDVGVLQIKGNDFKCSGIAIYKAGTGSSIIANEFAGSGSGGAIYANYHCNVKNNTFTANTTALVMRTAFSALQALIVQGNTFNGNTTALDANTATRSVALLDNTFANNTATALVPNGADYNGWTVDGNRVLSGTAIPAVGTTDSVATVHSAPIPTVSALPTAVAGLRGRMVRLLGAAGAADQVYVCRKNASDVYEWAAAL